jgi:hypothetical protein
MTDLNLEAGSSIPAHAGPPTEATAVQITIGGHTAAVVAARDQAIAWLGGYVDVDPDEVDDLTPTGLVSYESRVRKGLEDQDLYVSLIVHDLKAPPRHNSAVFEEQIGIECDLDPRYEIERALLCVEQSGGLVDIDDAARELRKRVENKLAEARGGFGRSDAAVFAKLHARAPDLLAEVSPVQALNRLPARCRTTFMDAAGTAYGHEGADLRR